MKTITTPIICGSTYDSVKFFKDYFKRWCLFEDVIEAKMNYDPNMKENNYPLEIKTTGCLFRIKYVSAGYKGIGSLGTLEILKFLGFDVNPDFVFSNSSFSLLYKSSFYKEAAKWWRLRLEEESKSPKKKNLLNFEKQLAEEIRLQVEQHGKIVICTKYGPETWFLKIAFDNDISYDLFPWGVNMYITPDKVVVIRREKEEIIFHS